MQPTIGLEIHVQLKTKTKMFCRCTLAPDGATPNAYTCPICWGYPGTLPFPNCEAIKMTVMLGTYLGGTIASHTKFDRKHYFYPDLPKGYQISQYNQPLVEGGSVPVLIEGHVRSFELERIHLEEDAGKLLHSQGGTIVDLNRAGTPLVEIVTKPVFHSPFEARAFLQGLRLIVRRLGISDADMEKGHLRCDANISVSGSDEHGVPVEIKNINSFAFVESALSYEIERQSKLVQAGKAIVKETRGFDEHKNITVSQRTKESAPDYRYFSEPDIPPFDAREFIEEKVKIALPTDEFAALKKEFPQCSSEELGLLVNRSSSKEQDWVAVFRAASKRARAEGVLAWMLHRGIGVSLESATLAAFVEGVERLGISTREAQEIIAKIHSGEKIETLLGKHASELVSEDDLERGVRSVIQKNPQAWADLKAGKIRAQGYLIGQLTRTQKGKIDPRRDSEIIDIRLKEE